MTSEIKAAIRLKRLMSVLDISNADRHGKRLGKIAHVDPSRSALNRHWEYRAGELVRVNAAPDLAHALERRREDREATRRANTPTLATEIMFITSRAAFENGAGQIDSERAYQWADQMLAAFEERFPAMTAAARLDLDERTPHLSIFAVPIYMKEANKPRADVSEDARARRKPRAPKPTVSHKQVFGGIEEMRELQRWVQGENEKFLAPLGLKLTASTPRTESRANHIHPDDFRRVMEEVERLKAEAEENGAKLIADAHAAAEAITSAAEQSKSEAVKKAAQAAAEMIENATEKAAQAAASTIAAATDKASSIRATAEEDAAQIRTDAEDARAAARTAAIEAHQAAEEARQEAKTLLEAVKVAQPMKPLHDAYKSLLDGSNLTPRQALAADTAADEDRKWINYDPVAFPREGASREDRDAAVWLAHPEIVAEVKAEQPDPLLADLIEPASGSTIFRARFFSRFRALRDLVMQAVEKVIQRHAAIIRQEARELMSDTDFEQSAKLGGRLMDDTWGDLRAKVDMDTPGRTKSDKCKKDWREWERLKVRDAKPVATAREELYAEAEDHARAAAVTAARIERGPRQVVQWLSIPRDLRQTFVGALDAAAALETALARRMMPAEAPEVRPGGATPRDPGPGL